MKALIALGKKYELDAPVFFSILTKAWGFLRAPVAVFLITTFFSKDLQGYYYTFGSVLALQIFVELGLGAVVQQFASHEWAGLSFDNNKKIVGDKDSLSRLISIVRFSIQWYGYAAVLATIGLSIGGYFFFSTSEDIGITWKLPWIILCISTGLTIFLTPAWSLLAGCNQVKNLYGFWLIQKVIIAIVSWIAIILGAKLWAIPISGIAGLIVGIAFIKIKYWNFFKTLVLSKSLGPTISWKNELLPFQWRIATSWISGYFSFQLFTPILFKFHGPEVAGQFGMTWSMIRMLGHLPHSWFGPKIPTLAIFVAKKQFDKLHKLFWKVFKIIVILVLGLSILIWGGVYFLKAPDIMFLNKLSERLLTPTTVAILLIAQSFQIFAMPFGAYLRTFKKDPLVYLSIISSIAILLSTIILGKLYSAIGVATGYGLVMFLGFPFVLYIWNNFRKKNIPLTYSNSADPHK